MDVLLLSVLGWLWRAMGEMVPDPEIQGVTIVLIGDLNPKIFHPDWFALNEIIARKEAEDADVELVHPDVSSFALRWGSVQVTRERFTVSTALDPYFDFLREFTLRTFALLKHTPLRAMGINSDAHFRVPDQEQWHAFGHRLAPKEFWNDILDSPGMRTLVIEEAIRRDKRPGRLQVRVEPSNRIQPGVYVAQNDHYVVEDPEKAFGATELMKILDSGWNASRERSKQILEKIGASI